MKRMLLLAAAIGVWPAAAALAQTPPAQSGKPDLARAQTIVNQVCAACHGADGNKTLDNTYPRLAGQYADYLEKAMRDYRSGKRKNAIMGAQAQPLTDKEIADVAAYYAAQKSEIHDLSH